MSTDWPTGLMVVQGNRLEDLRSLMVNWIQRYPLHPLENEVILVQSNGIAQWLKLALAAEPGEHGSGGCGIAAALDVKLPGRFIWQLYRSLLNDLPQSSPFDKEPLSWRLYHLLGNIDRLQQAQSEPNCMAPLAGFLEGDSDARRRYQLAARLADLFDQYQVYRADWLTDWQNNQNAIRTARGEYKALADEQLWQAALWRALVEDIRHTAQTGGAQTDTPWASASRAAIHGASLKAARELSFEQRPEELPRRVIVFGISCLPQQILEALESIAHLSQVLLFVSNPSRHYWGDLIEGRDLLRREYRRNPQRKLSPDLDLSALHLQGHPLLAAWGKQGRDYLHLLDEHDQPQRYQQLFGERIDLFSEADDDTLLGQLQGDILELRSLSERQALQTVVRPAQDHSLQFLVAHSAQREVEILQDQLLDVFDRSGRDRAPLQARNVLVMVPDIHQYAPHIEAVFGRISREDPRYLPFHISDQGQRHRNPLLIALEQLLHLPDSRFTVSEMLDLLDIAALRNRFRIDEADLPRLHQWVQGANIRWGLHAEQRERLDLPPGLEQNTWLYGIRRMLLGFASGSAGSWQGIEPYDEVGGLEAALIGPLAQLLEHLEHSWRELQQPRTPGAWAAYLHQLIDDYFVVTQASDSIAIDKVQQALEAWQECCQMAGAGDSQLPLEVLRESLLAKLEEPALTQRFLAGSITFATLMPMRAIPFRQVWMLGMNDGDYPRSVQPVDFDLMAGDYRPGDRSRRDDDRYLFLEALLSAREKLVISWVGRSIRDNSERPPSVLVGQLRDHLAAGWRLQGDYGSDAAAREALLNALTVTHPLQAFSRRYFETDRQPGLFTYAHEWRATHAGSRRAGDRPPSSALPAPQLEAPINLADLTRFMRSPVAHFYQRRLGIAWFDDDETVEDDERFALEGLDRWKLQDQLLQHLARQLAVDREADPQHCLQLTAAQLERSGQLPLPPFAEHWKAALTGDLELAARRYQELLGQCDQRLPPQSHQWTCAPGVFFEDSLTDLYRDSEQQTMRVVLQASRLHRGNKIKWYQLVRQWPTHLAAQLQQPVITQLLGPDTDFRLPPIDARQARQLLDELLTLYQLGLREPLPLPCKTAFAYLENDKPAQTYEGGFKQGAEREEHAGYSRFWPDYAALNDDPRFSQLAENLYRPLMLAVQAITSRQ